MSIIWNRITNLYAKAESLRKHLLVNWLRYGLFGGLLGLVVCPILPLISSWTPLGPWQVRPIDYFIFGFHAGWVLPYMFIVPIVVLKMLISFPLSLWLPDHSPGLAGPPIGITFLTVLVGGFAGCWARLGVMLITSPHHFAYRYLLFFTWLAMSVLAEPRMRTLIDRVQSYLDNLYDLRLAERRAQTTPEV